MCGLGIEGVYLRRDEALISFMAFMTLAAGLMSVTSAMMMEKPYLSICGRRSNLGERG